MRWALLLLVLLANCGGSAPDTGTPPTDEMLQRETHAGQLAFELERNEEAAAQYRTALSRAQARDDPDAIRDMLIEGFSHFVTSMTAPIASRWSEAGGACTHRKTPAYHGALHIAAIG